MKSLLFLDDWMVERRVGLERVWGKPQFVKELFTDYPPTGLGFSGYDSVFYDERAGRYVMYLAVWPPQADSGTFVVRLESDDPTHWPNPSFDAAVEPMWQGFNDVVLTESGERFWPTVVASLAGTPLAGRGYAMTCINPDRPQGNSLFGFSSDGMRFHLDRQHPWQDIRSDTWSGIVWNERAGLFQIFTRPACADRRIAVITTPDFETFSPVATLLQPDAWDPLGSEFYSMPVRAYEDIFIGMLHFQRTDPFEEKRIKMNGRMETELTYSYNGFNWNRTERAPFIGTRAYGEQGAGQVCAMDLLRTQEDRLLFYVCAGRGEHGAYPDMQQAGMDASTFFTSLLYEMRLDGFCSLKTLGKDGLLRTRTLIPQSGKITLNLRTSQHTSVLVQLLDGETAEPIPGYTWAEALPISGDHLFARPAWQQHQDIAELVGRPLRMEIKMREAELFAIRLDHHIFVGKTPTETL